MDYAAEAKREVGSLRKRYPEKPPAGIQAELDAMKQEKANEAGMKVHEGRKLATGGAIPVSKQDPANSNIKPKNTVVGASPKEQQIEAAKTELAKFAGPNKNMPSAGPGLHPGQEPPSMSPAQAQAMMGPATSATTPSIAASPNRRFAPTGRAGITRQYAKGGSVKGGGCEQRGLRKCKVV